MDGQNCCRVQVGEGTTTSSGLSLAGKGFSASRYGAFRDWSENYFSPQPLPFDIPNYNQDIGIKMNSGKRKERPNDNDRGNGAKRNKVCNMVTFFYTNIFRRNSNLRARMTETVCCEILHEHMTRACLIA